MDKAAQEARARQVLRQVDDGEHGHWEDGDQRAIRAMLAFAATERAEAVEGGRLGWDQDGMCGDHNGAWSKRSRGNRCLTKARKLLGIAGGVEASDA